MLPQTDLNQIKSKAKLFLMFDLQPVEDFPFIVKHPFTDSNYTLDQSTGTLVNLLEDDTALGRWRTQITKQIESADNVHRLSMMLTNEGTENIETNADAARYQEYFCTVYAGNDDERSHSLDEFYAEIEPDDKTSEVILLQRKIASHIDECYDDIVENQQYYFAKRQSELLGRLVCWINENEDGEGLYNTLSEVIGMTDDEIRSVGFTSLVPFFDREAYAQTIAEYLIDEGTVNTFSGNLHIPFSEINERFGVNLPTDEEMLELIRDELLKHGDIISDLETNEDFDMMFFTMYCPYVEDDAVCEDDGERPHFIPQM